MMMMMMMMMLKVCKKTASTRKILQKSGNRLLNYGQKLLLKFYGGRLPFLKFKKILKMFVFGHLAAIEFQVCCYVPNFIKM